LEAHEEEKRIWPEMNEVERVVLEVEVEEVGDVRTQLTRLHFKGGGESYTRTRV